MPGERGAEVVDCCEVTIAEYRMRCDVRGSRDLVLAAGRVLLSVCVCVVFPAPPRLTFFLVIVCPSVRVQVRLCVRLVSCPARLRRVACPLVPLCVCRGDGAGWSNCSLERNSKPAILSFFSRVGGRASLLLWCSSHATGATIQCGGYRHSSLPNLVNVVSGMSFPLQTRRWHTSQSAETLLWASATKRQPQSHAARAPAFRALLSVRSKRWPRRPCRPCHRWPLFAGLDWRPTEHLTSNRPLFVLCCTQTAHALSASRALASARRRTLTHD